MGTSRPTNYPQGSFPNLPGANPQWFNNEFTKIKKSFNSIVGPQKAGMALMGPASGSAPPTYRQITAADVTGVLHAANNLSDVANTATARTNLGLGSAALANTGTSGHNLPFLDGSNTWSANQVFEAINNTGFIMPGVAGVVGTNVSTNDDHAAVQAIFDAYADVVIAPGTFWVSQQVTINVSGGHYRARGAGAYYSAFIGKAAFTGGGAVVAVSLPPNVAVDYDIGGFSVVNQTAGSGASWGFNLTSNTSANYAGGNTKSRIYGVVSSGFAFNLLAFNVRMVVWERCASWPQDNSNVATTTEHGIYCYASAGQFCGDMDFDACQTVAGGASSVCVSITDQGGASVGLHGFRFRNHTYYQKYVGLQVYLTGTNSSASDIWSNQGSQYDGSVSLAAVYLYPGGSGSAIGDLHIDGCYFSFANSGGGIKGAIPVGGGKFFSIKITGNEFLNPSTSCVDIRGTNGNGHGVVCSHNLIYANDSTSYPFYFENFTSITAIGNTGDGQHAATPAYFIAANNTTTCDYAMIIGNNSGGCFSTAPVALQGTWTHGTGSPNV